MNQSAVCTDDVSRRLGLAARLIAGTTRESPQVVTDDPIRPSSDTLQGAGPTVTQSVADTVYPDGQVKQSSVGPNGIGENHVELGSLPITTAVCNDASTVMTADGSVGVGLVDAVDHVASDVLVAGGMNAAIPASAVVPLGAKQTAGKVRVTRNLAVRLYTDQSERLKLIFESIRESLSDALIIFDKNGMELVRRDNPGVLLISLSITADKIRETGGLYECSEKCKIGVDLRQFTSVLKCVGATDSLGFIVDRNLPLRFVVESHNPAVNEFSRWILADIDVEVDEEAQIPSIQSFDVLVTLDSVQFHKLIRNLSVTGASSIRIRTDGQQLQFHSSGVFMDSQNIIEGVTPIAKPGEEDVAAAGGMSEKKRKIEEVDMSYSMSVLQRIAKAKGIGRKISLYLRANYVAAFCFDIPIGSLKFILAPKLDDDEEDVPNSLVRRQFTATDYCSDAARIGRGHFICSESDGEPAMRVSKKRKREDILAKVGAQMEPCKRSKKGAMGKMRIQDVGASVDAGVGAIAGAISGATVGATVGAIAGATVGTVVSGGVSFERPPERPPEGSLRGRSEYVQGAANQLREMHEEDSTDEERDEEEDNDDDDDKEDMEEDDNKEMLGEGF